MRQWLALGTIALLSAALLLLAWAKASPTHFLGASSEVTTNWTAGAFSSDLSVGGNLTVTGASSTVGGYAVAASLEKDMTNSTSTPCAVYNSSGHPRQIDAAQFTFLGTSDSGVTTVVAGTSTDAFTSSTSPLINSVVTKIPNRITTSATSSAMTANYIWLSGEWFVWKTSTTTNSGQCEALWY